MGTQNNQMAGDVPALDVRDVRAGYDKRQVLHGVSLSVSPGQTYGLIGLNGVGKTTLIKSILGLKDLMGGEISLFGVSHSRPDARVRVAYLPERFDPPWFLKGGEFIEFSASLYGRGVSEADMIEACQDVALDPAVLKNKVQSYSKGMRQKLGLIATVLTGCDLLILDEPMSGLDPMARSLVRKLLTRAKSKGRTVVLSSHILADLDEICDYVTVVHDGSTPFTGPPSELRRVSEEESLEKAFLKVIKVAA